MRVPGFLVLTSPRPTAYSIVTPDNGAGTEQAQTDEVSKIINTHSK